jgi:AraC-like DNA-binding protein
MTSWLNRISPQLNIVWHGRWTAGQQEPARYLYDHELVIVTQGSCQVRLDSTAYELGQGDYLIIPPDTLHVTSTGKQGVERYCFHFDWVPSSKPASHPFCCFYPARPSKAEIATAPAYVPRNAFQGRWRAEGTVRPVIESLVHRWQTRDPLPRALCRAVFLELLTLLFWVSTGQPERHSGRAEQLAYAVKDLLDRTEEGREGIQALLASLGFSYPHLCRLFHRQFGVTPAEYRTAVRLERAKTLLRDPRISISEVAYASGFQDPAYFARCFKKQNGIAPSAFR